jgi:uncharacterized protein (DUF169 family)
MQSKLVDALRLDNHAVAVMHTDEKPEGALEFEPGKWACVVTMFAAATRGKTAVFGRQTYGCASGGVGLCLTGELQEPPGGLAAFLAHGAGPGFREGEHYIKSEQLAQQFIDRLPKVSIPQDYVVLKPLGEVDPDREKPVLVVIFGTADQVSALHFMANYGREGGEAVYMPWGAGCHTLHLWPYMELRRSAPRAVLGGTDMTARPRIDGDKLGFSIPWPLFTEMERNVPGSFMTEGDWPKLLEHRSGPPAAEH